MRFPKERIRFRQLFEGQNDPEGYLVLDLKGLDIEGATSFVVEMRDVEAARKVGDSQTDAARRARELLGG